MTNSKKSGVLFLFHAVTFIYHIVVSHYSNRLHLHSSNCQYAHNLGKYSWRFMTSWNFVIQAVYFTLCMSEDVLRLTDIKSMVSIKRYLRTLKNYIFCAFAFPLAMTVTTVFWMLYFVNREFVFPKAIDVVFPAWLNHALHTNVVLFIFIELVLSFHHYSVPRKYLVAGMIALPACYYICYFSTYFLDGIWLYPIFEVMSWNQRVMFSLTVYLMFQLYTYFGELLAYRFWGRSIYLFKDKYKK